MKFTHHSITSITVEKVQNICTSFTRAGNGDDNYRRQRQKDKYVNCKKQQQQTEQKMREEFLKERDEKLRKHAELTEKRKDKRGKKKERSKQLRSKHRLLKKLGQEGNLSSDDDENAILPTSVTVSLSTQSMIQPERQH